jgi:TonB family protein
VSSRKENLLDWTNLPDTDSKVIPKALALAVVVEFLLLTFFGIQSHWIAHPPKSDNEAQFIEAEVFEAPKLEHLVESKPIQAPAQHEAVLSKVPGQGKKAKETTHLEEKNQTTSSDRPLPPTHGPLAVYAPPPSIPDYLRERDLNVSAVIDFYITAQGQVNPRLVGSTGNEELDALAIATAKKWQFRPAEQNHKSVDSKIRLRIVFSVH